VRRRFSGLAGLLFGVDRRCELMDAPSTPRRTSETTTDTRRIAMRTGSVGPRASLNKDKGSLSLVLENTGIVAAMAAPQVFDVLVVGSGASGLAAAVSAHRAGASVALVAKDAVQSCNSAKAQGGIQAAFGEDDSPEQHAEDVWQSSHESADRRLVEVLTGEAPGAIHWLEELGVEFTRENGGYRLARCGGASRKRLLQVGDRTGHAITSALRDAVGYSSFRSFP
jgi:threonine dehydrogenase-like Zn-dependent dehydrogenase